MITTPRLDTRRPARRHAFVRTIALITMFLLSGLAGPRVSLHAAPSPPIAPYELLHVFTGPDGLNPIGGLIQGTDGLFYGTTARGPDAGSDCGGVFQMDETGTVIPLHAFMLTDGCIPFGTLVQANDGSFYGTTFRGGANSRGTVFKIDPAGTFTVLHDFAGAPGDGSNPYGALIQATDGAFYGTTTRGGAADRGTAFRMDTTGAVTILHSFGADSDDGTEPWAGLIQASDGNFYGATIYGGNPNPPGCECNDRIPSGTVFQMDSAGNVAIRYNFSGSDGSAPYASLLEVNGVLYGSTAFGGPFADSYHPSGGGLFQMPLGDKLEFFYAFGGDPRDGQVPYGALIKASDGNLYGTTNYGGELVGGTIFKVGPDFSVVTLHAFEWNQSGPPAQPGSGLVGPLVQASDGRIYGSASGVIGFEALIDPGVLFRYSLLTNDQTISFGPLPNKTFGDPAFTVDATASSSLPVTFSASGNCSISGAMVSLTGAGNCTITAYQDGNQSFNPAPSVPQSFQIARAAAT